MRHRSKCACQVAASRAIKKQCGCSLIRRSLYGFAVEIELSLLYVVYTVRENYVKTQLNVNSTNKSASSPCLRTWPPPPRGGLIKMSGAPNLRGFPQVQYYNISSLTVFNEPLWLPNLSPRSGCHRRVFCISGRLFLQFHFFWCRFLSCT